MKSGRRIWILTLLLGLCLAMPAFSAKPQANSIPPSLPGQAVTLLPDGNWLLSGGQDANGHPLGALVLRDVQGNDQPLPVSFQSPRMWHTATVLPDGTVLIFGGIGSDGRVVRQAELFDPATQSSQLLNSGAPSPRVFHSSTLLTDGRVLIVGGVGENGKPLLSAELWDPRQKTSSFPEGRLTTPRRSHLATLLPDGRVLLSGGKD